jgi:hypothetical protein
MPTTPGVTSTPLNPQQVQEKFLGLITETSDELPETAPVEEPAKPAEVEQPAPSETPPPETSETAPTPEDETQYEVTVDEEPVQVSLAELKRSYSYQAHNTRKAQELAEREKRLEPELRQRVEAELAETRNQYLTGLEQLRAALQRLEGEPDWVAKRQELAPEEFLKQKADWEATKAKREQLARHEQEVAQEVQQAAVKQQLAYLRQEEQKLTAAVPEWAADVPKGKAEITKLAEFVRTKYAIPEAQVAQAFQTASAILLARDAYRYAELKREPSPQTKAKTAPIRTARPGTPERPRPNAKRDALLTQAAKTGRHRDAAKAIEDMLPD